MPFSVQRAIVHIPLKCSRTYLPLPIDSPLCTVYSYFHSVHLNLSVVIQLPSSHYSTTALYRGQAFFILFFLALLPKTQLCLIPTHRPALQPRRPKTHPRPTAGAVRRQSSSKVPFDPWTYLPTLTTDCHSCMTLSQLNSSSTDRLTEREKLHSTATP